MAVDKKTRIHEALVAYSKTSNVTRVAEELEVSVTRARQLLAVGRASVAEDFIKTSGLQAKYEKAIGFPIDPPKPEPKAKTKAKASVKVKAKAKTKKKTKAKA